MRYSVRQRMMFCFEGQRFSLGGGLTYGPDFILLGYSVGGRQVVLEPRGVWRQGHEEEVTEKLRGRSIKWSRGWPALSEVESLLDKRLDLLYTVGFDLLRASISIFDHSIP